MGILTADALSRVLGASNEEALTALKAAADNGWDLLSALYGGAGVPRYRPGLVYFATSVGSSTVNTLGNGTLRVHPWLVSRPVRIDRLGSEILATVGEAGSVLRLGIYADIVDGYGGHPGTLVLDAGTIPGDAVAVAWSTIDQRLMPGLYWVGGAVQLAPTTQPNVRTSSTGNITTPVTLGSQPLAAGGSLAWSMSGVTGALPATFSAPGVSTVAGSTPRIHFRVAA